jgi:flagellin
LGTVEARLNSAITNLTTSRENTIAAAARITDADIAVEAAELTRLNILQQAGAAVLAQANQQPSLAVQLLR